MSSQSLPAVTSRFQAEDVQLIDYRCCGSVRRPASTESADAYEIVFVRRGSFALWTRKRERIVTSNEMLFLTPGATYAVSHPVVGGDRCTILSLPAEAFAGRAKVRGGVHLAPAGSALFRTHSKTFALAASEHAEPFDVHERLCQLVLDSLRTFDVAIETDDSTATPTQRRVVRRAQEIIAAHYTEALPLTTIARLAGTSAFHLSRLFRKITGTSMHRYQTTLRLRAAMDRILGGWSDLASLALDLGYSSHSHFTAAFRNEFGASPAKLRLRATD